MKFITDTIKAVHSMLDVMDVLDEKGLGKAIPFIGEEHPLRDAVENDMLLFLFGIIDKEQRINKECIEFVNNCFDCSFTPLTIEIARKKILDLNVTEASALLPVFGAVDKGVKDSGLSSVYIKSVAYFALGFISLKDKTSLEEMVSYYHHCKKCVSIIEDILEIKLDFDPLANFKDEQRKIIELAIEVDEFINERQKPPVVSTEEDEKTVYIIKESGDGSDLEDESSEYIIKEAGDGSDLADESPVFIMKEPGDGSELSNSEIQLVAMNKLDKLIGLQDVKQQIKSMVNYQIVSNKCKEYNINRTSLGLHMIFTGNPGTGKTTIARAIGEIYKETGMLSKGHLVEVTRKDLVGQYVGHTASLVNDAFKKAKGGVLFIDEAYLLTSEGDSFGEEAVGTLLKLMEDNREDICVIVAGYPKLMQEFMDANPGLKSRFPFVVKFPDYSVMQLVKIFSKFCEENSISADRRILRTVRAHFFKERNGTNFGNARTVRNYFEKMLLNQANRLVSENKLERRYIQQFELEDIPKRGIEADIKDGSFVIPIKG